MYSYVWQNLCILWVLETRMIPLKKHTGDFFIVESVCLLCTFENAQVASMPSAIDSTQALLSNTLQAASIPGASPAMHLGDRMTGTPLFLQQERSSTTEKVLQTWWNKCFIEVRSVLIPCHPIVFAEGYVFLGDDKEAREFLVEVVSSWIINGSQHLVMWLCHFIWKSLYHQLVKKDGSSKRSVY